MDTFNYLWKPVLEIALIFLIIYAIIRFVQGTRGEGILKGLTTLTLVAFFTLWWVANEVELHEIRFLIEKGVGGVVIALLIIFQPELRRGLVRISTANPFATRQMSEALVIDEVRKAVLRMSKNKIGAIIAIERDVGLRGYVEKGTRLDSEVKSEIIESVFYPGSALHDGALVIQEGRIAAAGCLFPLTENPDVGKSMGTRHRAGIGLTEETDAITVIVSEETGNVSLGVNGALFKNLDSEGLDRMLGDLYLRFKEPVRGGAAS